MPRAIFYCNLPPPFTGQTVGTEVLRRLLEDELDISVLDTSSRSSSLERGPFASLRRALSMVRHALSLRRELGRDRAAVLYFVASSSAPGQLRDALTVAVSRSRAARIVAHVRSGDYHRNFDRTALAWVTRFVVRRLDALIFLSPRLADRSARSVPAEKLHVVPNTIDDAVRLSADEARTKIEQRVGRDALRVLYLSNMIPSKGYFDLARALARLASSVAFEADLVGDWPSAEARAELERYLREHRLDDRVRVHGSVVDRSRVRRLLVGADAFVLPTYYPVEAQPRSIIEALNAAVPVVTTAHASIPDYIRDGDNGYLVEPRSPASIAAALERLADARAWQSRATAARQSYEEHFDSGSVRAQLLEAFLG